MKDIVDRLKIRYEAALQSSSDSLFYQNVHAYIDFIVKTPVLSAIMDKGEEEYHNKHSEIVHVRALTDQKADEKEQLINRLERFSLLAAHYCTLLIKIYNPIEDYKNSTEPDAEQDPVALLMLKGIKNINTQRWGQKTLEIYNGHYDGKRKSYEDDLRQFHVDFLTEIEKVETIKEKPKISFDKENSILHIDDKDVHIKLKNDKPNDHYVLEYIFENEEGLKEKSFYSDIIKIKFEREKVDNMSLYRSCKAISRKVSEQAGLSNFLVIKSGKTGYTHINPDYL